MYAAMLRKRMHVVGLRVTIAIMLATPLLGVSWASAGQPADGEISDEQTTTQPTTQPSSESSDDDGVVTADSDSESQASITLRHTVTPGTATVGDLLTFHWEITNTGIVTLLNIKLIATSLDGKRSFDGNGTPIADADGEIHGLLCSKIGSPFESFDVLAPGDTISCRATYQTVDKDADQKSVTAWAHVTAETPTDYVGDAVYAEDFASARVKQTAVLTGGSIVLGTTGAVAVALLGVLAGAWAFRRRMVPS